jgi:hypothetical protein
VKIASNAHTIKGFSLAEIIISLFLSSVILLLLLRYYVSIKQQFIHVQSVIEAEADLAWITDLIRSKINQAGFTPCGNIKYLHSQNNSQTKQQLIDVKMQNFPVARLDLYHMSEPVIKIKQILDPTHLLLDSYADLKENTVLIADCHFAETQVIKQQSKQIVTLSQSLIFNYHDPIYVGVWEHDAFFVKNNAMLIHESKQKEELSASITDLLLSGDSAHISVKLLDKNQQSTQIVAAVRSR